MEKAVSAAEANRHFSALLPTVREGYSYIVTWHGKAGARIVPIQKDGGATRGARAALLNRLRSQSAVKVGRWNRDELYED